MQEKQDVLHKNYLQNFKLEIKSMNRFRQSRVVNTSRSPFLEWFQNQMTFAKKQKLLFRGAMIRRRSVYIPTHLQKWFGTVQHAYTFSNLAGHGAFIFLALSYLESDFLSLRVYAVSGTLILHDICDIKVIKLLRIAILGIALSIIFQYYREHPLLIPIRWNGLFLTINIGMIALLLKEANDANALPKEQIEIFQALFEAQGMNSVEFSRLMSIVTRRECMKGEKIITQDRQHDVVYVIQSGKVTVRKDGNLIGRIGKNGFVGEMAFVRWVKKKALALKARADSPSSTTSDTTALLYGWKATLPVVIFPTWEENSSASSGSDSSLSHISGGGVGTSMSPADTLDQSNQTSQSNEIIVIGSADVICDEDCVMYCWKFSDLDELLSVTPGLRMVFERCISADLNEKIDARNFRERSHRYKQLVEGATITGEVTDKQKARLAQFRAENGIKESEHYQVLRELGWTGQEYKLGSQG